MKLFAMSADLTKEQETKFSRVIIQLGFAYFTFHITFTVI